MMDLSAFSSYFEIFTALTLAYAGSEKFRYAVDDLFTQYGDSVEKLSKQLEIRESELTVLIKSNTLTEAKAITLGGKISEIQALLTAETEQQDFPEGFRSMFLNTGIYCICILVLIGFSKEMCVERVHVTLFFLNLSVIFNILVFLVSLLPSQCGKDWKLRWPVGVNTLFVAGGWIYVTLVASWLARHCSGESESVSLWHRGYFIWPALATATSPFILHMLRVVIHRLYHRRLFNKKLESLKNAEESTAPDHPTAAGLGSMTTRQARRARGRER